MNDVEKWIYRRKKFKSRFMKRIITKIIFLLGADIPWKTEIGNNVSFCHNALGTIISPLAKIEDNVIIYSNVTVGRSDFKSQEECEIIIKKGAVLCTGARILAKDRLVVGENTIIAANAVLLESTGDNEVWGGIPAKCLKKHISNED